MKKHELNKIRIISSQDKKYVLNKDGMFTLRENTQHGYTVMELTTPALSWVTVRKILRTKKGFTKRWSYELSLVDGRPFLRIGCQSFTGDHLAGLRRWAGID